jgi:hypothetical protein
MGSIHMDNPSQFFDPSLELRTAIYPKVPMFLSITNKIKNEVVFSEANGLSTNSVRIRDNDAPL